MVESNVVPSGATVMVSRSTPLPAGTHPDGPAMSSSGLPGALVKTLRKGLRGEKTPHRLPRFVVKPKACGFRPGVDVLRLNRLNDELELEDFQRKLASEVSER